MRWIGYTLGGLVLLLVIAVAAVVLMPTGWIVERAERFVADSYGLELDIGGLDLDILTMTPGASVSSVSLGDGEGDPILAEADARVAVDLGSLIGGRLVVDELALSNADIDLAVDESGRGNWQDLLDALPAAEETEATEEEGTIPAIRSLSIEDVHVDFTDERFDRTLSLDVAASGSTTDSARPTVLEADGTLDDVPLDIDVELASLDDVADAFADPLARLAVDATAVAGDTRLTVDGTLGEPAEVADPKLAVSFSAPDAEDIAALAGIELPALPSMEFTTDVRRDGDEFVLRRLDARLGDNAIEGDVRADPTTTPPSLYANLIAERFDLDAILGLLDDGETEAAAEEAADEEAEPGGPLLPDTPIDLSPLATVFDGAIRLRLETIVSEALPLDSLDLRLESEGATLTLTPELGVADGEIAGDVEFDTAETPPGGTVELAARGIELNRIVASLGIDDDSFGTLGGRAKFWLAGESVAALAGGADGGLYLAMQGGKLDALLVELSAIDLIESIVLAVDPGKTTTAVDCGYADLQAEGGVFDIATFVLESADTVYVVDGSIDLGAETLDVTLEPHPRDASLLSATTSVNVSGPFDDPDIAVGGELGARAAVGAALAAVAAPAAALLAFVDTGGGEDSPYCKGLVNALPDEG